MKVALGVTAVATASGLVYQLHDTLLIATGCAAIGLLWATRRPSAWLISAGLLAVGLFWSSLDSFCCSAWSKVRILRAKALGELPQVAWNDVGRALTSWECEMKQQPGEETASTKFLAEKMHRGQKLEQFRTTLGDFWLPAPGHADIEWLIWELTVESDYESGDVAIRKGDVVVDCGAHVGVFSRFALRRGAGLVVAIEPDPTHIACLEANLAEEIAAGRVLLVKAGVWDRRDTLTLHKPKKSTLSNSFVYQLDDREAGLPVLPLDEIVKELQLDRVDFIKMDIEGSERRALKGAAKTIEKFRPRMALCTYHRQDDPVVLPRIVRSIHADYKVHGKDLDLCHGDHVSPKVLFFE